MRGAGHELPALRRTPGGRTKVGPRSPARSPAGTTDTMMEATPPTNDPGASARRPSHVVLLVVNLTILVAAVILVWLRLRDDVPQEPGRAPPLGTTAPLPPRSGARGLEPAAGRSGGRRKPVGAPGGMRAATRAEPAVAAATADGDAATSPAAAASPAVPTVSSSAAARAAAGEPPPPPRLRGQVDGEPRAPDVPPVACVPTTAAPRARAATERLIDGVGVHVEVLRATDGVYPSSARDFGTNRGVEALHAALARLGRTSGLRLGDTDDDGRMEILDAWGRPLVYFSADDYGTSQLWAPGDGAAVSVAARRSRASGGFRAASTYQLSSVGPGGAPDADGGGAGAGDDVTSWVSRD